MAWALLLVAATAHAQMTDPPPRDPVKWQLEMVYRDGDHIELSWKRLPERTQGVLVLRRTLPAGTELAAGPARAIDHPGPLLIPGFLYPSSRDTYHPAFDARSHPIPVGAHVGEWTVVAYVDADPAAPIVDSVAPETPYVYALIPATPGPDPGTYAQFGDAVYTESITVAPRWFQTMWFRAAVVTLAATILLAIGWLVIRSRRWRGSAPSS